MLDQEQFQKHSEQKFEDHFIYGNYKFNLQKKKKKQIVLQLANFSIFFKLVSINQQQSTADIPCFPTLKDVMTSHLNSAITKLFYCCSRDAKNGKNAKIPKISFFSDF